MTPDTTLPDPLVRQLALEYGTPLYVYREDVLRERLREIASLVSRRSFHPSISVKANGNPALLAVARSEGLAGDAMSPGEILLLERAGFGPGEIFFIPNNVSVAEFRFATDRGILTSLDSLDQLRAFGEALPGNPVALRINPGLGDGHHAKVVTAGDRTKFGILPDELPEAVRLLRAHDLRLRGLNQHIGSGFLEPSRYLEAASILLGIAESFPELDFIDFGGGFGIPYREGEPRLDMAGFGRKLDDLVSEWTARTGLAPEIRVEPGRYWCAECGTLVGTVLATKARGRTVVAGTDLGFNVLQRPVLYDAHHRIDLVPAGARIEVPCETVSVTWVGNICESGDILGSERPGPRPLAGDLVRVRDAGAYGWAMSSSYNARPRAAEVLVGMDGSHRLVRRRETWEELFSTLP